MIGNRERGERTERKEREEEENLAILLLVWALWLWFLYKHCHSVRWKVGTFHSLITFIKCTGAERASSCHGAVSRSCSLEKMVAASVHGLFLALACLGSLVFVIKL